MGFLVGLRIGKALDLGAVSSCASLIYPTLYGVPLFGSIFSDGFELLSQVSNSTPALWRATYIYTRIVYVRTAMRSANETKWSVFVSWTKIPRRHYSGESLELILHVKNELKIICCSS